MAYLFDETWIDAPEGNPMPQGVSAYRDETHAGAGACSKCGCQQFERWGANADQCGNTSCAHSWADHY